MSDDLHSLAAIYAVDALDELDRRHFEVHLESCEQCRAEVDAFGSAAALLTSEDVQPSKELRSSTLALITQTQQAEPLDAARTHAPSGGSGSGSTVGGPSDDASPKPPGVESSVTRFSGWTAQQWMLSAAAVLVVVAALAAVAVMANRTSGNDPSDEVATVLDAPDAIHIVMRTDDPARASTDLEVVHSSDHNATVVIGDHVHGTDPGQTYQLWGITPGGMVAAGVFEPSGDGTVQAPVGTPEGVEGWAVTVEPAGGSPGPTGDPVFISET